MTGSPRIAVVSTMAGFPWGGSEELWAEMAAAASSERVPVVASVYRWPVPPAPLAALRERGVSVLTRRHPRSRLGRVARRVRSPFHDVAAFRPDVVCISQGGPYEFDATPGLIAFLDRARVPFVVVCQCSHDQWIPDPGRRRRAVDFFARAARVVFVSEQNRLAVERQLAAPIPNASVARNPANLADLVPVPWPDEPGARLASVARLEVGFKGQDVLLEALAAGAWRSRDWRLSLYGAGPDREYVSALAAHYGIAGRVSLHGFVPDVRAVWARGHLMVLPSRAEGMPLAVVEAMLCGRPAVATDVGGIAEWIEDGVTGFIAEAPTARSLGAALERAWAAQKDWPAIGQAAHERAMALFDAAAGRSLLALLRSVARRDGAA
jgi:L-malate glycosyltransferase